MRTVRAAGCLAMLLLISLESLPAWLKEDAPPKKVPDSWFATGVVRVGGRIQITNYWSSGSKFRAETIIAGHRVVTIVNGDIYYSFDDVAAAGIAIKRDKLAVAVDAKRGRPFADEWSQLLRAGGERIGSETLEGRECEVFRLTNSTGRRTVWVSIEDPRVPVRVHTFDRKTAREEVLEYAGWMRGLLVADEFFQPAKHVDRRDTLLDTDRPGPATRPVLDHGSLHALNHGGAAGGVPPKIDSSGRFASALA